VLVCVNHATVVKCESLFSRPTVTEELQLHIRDWCLNTSLITDVIRIYKQINITELTCH